MRKALWLLAGLAVLALVAGLAGCGGMNEATGTGVDTAGKPPPPGGGLPPVGSATGSIYYQDFSSGKNMRMAWDGTSPTVVCTGVAMANGFEVSHRATNRFLLYSKSIPLSGMSNIFMVPDGGTSPINIMGQSVIVYINGSQTTFASDHFQVWTPSISLDDSTILISGAGLWSHEMNDFDPATIGSYLGELDYGIDGLPTGIKSLTKVSLAGSLAPDKTRAAWAWAPVSGQPADLWVWPSLQGDPTNQTNTATLDERGAAWSPVGDRIAYTRPVVGSNGRTQGYDIYTVNPDGTVSLRAVTKANSNVVWNGAPWGYADWSPDATQLVFGVSQTQTGPCAIMRTAANGTTAAASLTGFTISRVGCLKWRP